MESKKFKLVDTTYNPRDAKEVLVSIINDKITSINRIAFGKQERKGEDVEHLQNRIKQLQKERLDLVELLADAHSKGLMVKIDANISVEFIKVENKVLA